MMNSWAFISILDQWARYQTFFLRLIIYYPQVGENYWPWVFAYTIVDYGVYTSFGYHTFLQPISKTFLAIKDITKPLLHAKFHTYWFETVENRSNLKSIYDSGLWCIER